MFESIEMFLLWLFCTYVVVRFVIGMHQALTIHNENLHTQLINRLDEIVHRVEVVEDKSMYYWYDQDDKEFLAQGKTTEEIINNIKSRFPDHIFYLEESNSLICAKHGWEPQPTNTFHIQQ